VAPLAAAEGAVPDLQQRLDEVLAPAANADAAGGVGSQEQDARTLWVDWDAHGERYKEWRQVVQESHTEEYKDSPLEGGPTALYMMKSMQKQGGDPQRWLEAWIREKRIEPTDRVMHELRPLIDSLYYFGVFDQLNLGGLIGVEVLCRRLASIVEAYGQPGKVDWSSAKYYRGVTGLDEVIAPGLRSYVVRRNKDEAEIHNARVRATGLRGSPTNPASLGDGGAAEGGEGGNDDKSKHGKGKGGRGARGPPAST